MVTEALFVLAAPGSALAWPAPVLPGLGLAGPAMPAEGDAPGSVPAPLAG
jgi:hypothetical protein